VKNSPLFGIPTANKKGYVRETLVNEYGQLFLDYVKHLFSPTVLDIGAAYGLTTSIPALTAGAFVVANDLDTTHLDVLKSKAPAHLLDHLTLCAGKFPQEIDFSSNNFDAIVMLQVLHFLKAEEIEQGIPLLYDWLKPGGKVFLTVISPYIGVLRDFLPVYQARKEQKISWPGQVENIKEYCNHPCTSLNPDFIHVFEPDILEKIFLKVGFNVEKVGFYPIHPDAEPDFRNDGRECVGIIASKPL